MRMTWICPTWNRPKCLANLVRQFLAQDYPAHEIDLLILDDAGQYENQSGDDGSGGHRWQIVSFQRPFVTLPEKYNALLGMVASEAIVVAEDDDLYSPQHSAACAATLAGCDYAKPSKVITLVHGKTQIEPADGRFHASIAIRTDFARHVGGWPLTRRADFDLQMLARLKTVGAHGDPIRDGFDPTYTFVWEASGHYHAQAYGRGPTDEGWLERARAAAGKIEWVGKVTI